MNAIAHALEADWYTIPRQLERERERLFRHAWQFAGPVTLGVTLDHRLVELGPGRGTLMADLLRATVLEPAFLAAASLDLVEVSPDPVFLND